jgi:SAM-dependent methyltransferase
MTDDRGPTSALDAVREGRPVVLGLEIDELGALDGCRLVHLPCGSAAATLDLVRAHPTMQATGVEPSAEAVAAAAGLAEELRLSERARFVEADVYRASETLAPASFDLVYAGRGSLAGMADIGRWAAVSAELLRSGGSLYLCDVHPAAAVLSGDPPTPVRDYFSTDPTDPGAEVPDGPYHWQHSLASILRAVNDVGLRLLFLHEWSFSDVRVLPGLRRRDDRTWSWPGPGSLPLMFSLKAARPE